MTAEPRAAGAAPARPDRLERRAAASRASRRPSSTRSGTRRPRPSRRCSPRSRRPCCGRPTWRRARQTAAYVAKETGLEPVYDARLREYDVGDRQGLTLDETPRWRPRSRGVPGAATSTSSPAARPRPQVVRARMVAAVRDAARRARARRDRRRGRPHGAASATPSRCCSAGRSPTRAALRGLDNCGWVELDQPDPDGPLRLSAYNRVAPPGADPDFASGGRVG